ncbi:MAG: hypothetical protein Kow00133_06150 [Amphiplicatus sp.]
MRLSSAGLAAGALLASCLSGPALAQQHIDEPRLDPFFGRKYERPKEYEAKNEEPKDDERFDANQRWTPLRGFVGILTFMTPETTNLSIGVGPELKPDYFGSDDYEVVPDPAAYVKFRNFVFLDDDGADIALFGFSNFRAGPTLRIVGDREEDDNSALAGLGDVGMTFEFGGFAAATFQNRYSFRFKVRHGLKTGHRGTIVDATLTALLFRFGDVSTSLTAQTAWIGNRYADAYFTVTPEQSAASGLPEYDAKAGFRDIGGSVNGYINVGKHWSINPYVSYRYIFDGIADTPIIALAGDRHQWTTGFHVMREFSFNIR